MKVDDFSARPALGVGLKITAILLFTCMSAIIKSLADDEDDDGLAIAAE